MQASVVDCVKALGIHVHLTAFARERTIDIDGKVGLAVRVASIVVDCR